MSFKATVVAQDVETEQQWVGRLGAASRGIVELSVESARRTAEPGQLIFFDANVPIEMIEKTPRKGRALFLIMPEGARTPQALIDGKVDDVLIWPFRPLELLSKIYRYQQVLMWDEVGQLNNSFSDLLSKIGDDLKLAERLQKNKLPIRFPEVKGFKILSRYLAGMKAGGDHADLAESQDKGLISIVLSDSSSYGLSSNVLSVLMRVAMKLSSDETRSSVETVKRIHEELLLTLGEKDRLSLFYGTLSRKDYRLRYLNLGGSLGFYAKPKQGFELLAGSGSAITRSSGPIDADGQRELVLDPEGRLVLLSDGFVEAAGGVEDARALLDSFREKDAADLLNEMVFKVKAKFEDPDDMPAQDCTGIVFDVESRLIRLAPV